MDRSIRRCRDSERYSERYSERSANADAEHGADSTADLRADSQPNHGAEPFAIRLSNAFELSNGVSAADVAAVPTANGAADTAAQSRPNNSTTLDPTHALPKRGAVS